MEVFRLSLLVCISVFDQPGGDVMSRQCRWEGRDYYAVEASCQVAGAPEVGRIWFSGGMYLNSSEMVDRYRCSRIAVRE